MLCIHHENFSCDTVEQAHDEDPEGDEGKVDGGEEVVLHVEVEQDQPEGDKQEWTKVLLFGTKVWLIMNHRARFDLQKNIKHVRKISEKLILEKYILQKCFQYGFVQLSSRFSLLSPMPNVHFFTPGGKGNSKTGVRILLVQSLGKGNTNSKPNRDEYGPPRYGVNQVGVNILPSLSIASQ